MLGGVADVTQILAAIEQGNPRAAEELLPLVYDELRKLAAARLAGETPGQTLQATALVHEAYLRLVGPADAKRRDRKIHRPTIRAIGSSQAQSSWDRKPGCTPTTSTSAASSCSVSFGSSTRALRNSTASSLTRC